MKRPGHGPVRVICPLEERSLLDFSELYATRQLAWVFVKRGVLTRYRQMALGVIWLFLEPLAQLLLMSVVFGLLIKIDTGDYPFTIFVFAALIPWLIMSKTLTAVASSLIDNIGIISKVYFPRLILPLSAMVQELLNGLVIMAMLVAMSWLYGYPPNWKLVLVPFLFAYLSLSALGIGLLFASITVKYRDFRPLLGVLIQAGFYTTPVFYPADLVPQALRFAYEMNPMYWGVEFSRWIMLDKPVMVTPSIYASFGLLLLSVLFGYVVFAKSERSVIDAQ